MVNRKAARARGSIGLAKPVEERETRFRCALSGLRLRRSNSIRAALTEGLWLLQFHQGALADHYIYSG